MKLVFNADEFICQWVGSRVDATIIKGRAIGVADGEKLVAAVAYSNFRGCDVEMLCAAENAHWLSRERLRVFFYYPFVQLGCLRVTAIIDKRNRQSRRFVEKVGFRLEGSHPKALDGRDAVSYGMLREQCRWIEHGQEINAIRA